ncbi:MAG: glycosyl hydrolase family protein [Mucilaginibacter sp.]|nr:glycosyl hydrolase family protein [Mucilaginibacter sp.]
MKNLRISLFIILVSFLFAACGKKNEGLGSVGTPPTGLDLKAVVSTNGSGSVAFNATATNAVSYEFDFGNGSFQNSTNGTVTYKYPAEGTFTAKVTAKSSSGHTAVKSVSVTISFATGGTTPTWSEEFNTDGAPNPSVWGYDLGAGGWGNNELEYYTDRPTNVIVSGGTLKINLKKEDYMGSAYTSARLKSDQKFAFKYGRLEIKAKLPAGGGTWPAIWMLGSNYATSPWPACGEIDIMEHVGNQLNKIFGTLHYPGHSGANGNGANTTIPTATTDFHVYAVDWSATSVKISVDGTVFQTVANDASLPFNQNFFIILNVAMGGNFGGAVDPAVTGGTMEIDYIRLYQ